MIDACEEFNPLILKFNRTGDTPSGFAKGVVPSTPFDDSGRANTAKDFIAYLPSLIGTMQPIQYPSCVISDLSPAEEFARRLYEHAWRKAAGLVCSGRYARAK